LLQKRAASKVTVPSVCTSITHGRAHTSTHTHGRTHTKHTTLRTHTRTHTCVLHRRTPHSVPYL
jgi:hypothetical protein